MYIDARHVDAQGGVGVVGGASVDCLTIGRRLTRLVCRYQCRQPSLDLSRYLSWCPLSAGDAHLIREHPAGLA